MCQLLSRLVIYSNAKQIIELGTSMGITTLYLAKQMDTHVSTFEGNPALVSIAQTNFEYFNKSNIDLIEGNIDKSLPDFLQTNRTIDFVLMDANHRYEPTLNYVHQLAPRMSNTGIIVVDDIYHSAEMAKAWHEIRMHELVYGSIDLFRCGILFFDSSLNKQHHTCVW
jgi:predicted O-methyltransferase YrrM